MGRGRAILGMLAALFLLAGAAGAAQTARPPAGRAAEGGDQAGAEAHLELGKIYHRQVFEALDMAIKEYEAAVRLGPDSADGHYYLGLAYHSKAKLGSDDKALYTKAIQQYKLYLHYSPNGELAAKAKQNVAAVEALLGGRRAPAAKGAGKAGGQ